MTWSITYTKEDPNNATGTGTVEQHQFYTYFFDTFLPTKAGWTVGAHPTAVNYKRKLKYDVTNIFTGNVEPMYYWVDWANATTAAYMTWYEDATYTSVKQDLCNAGQGLQLLYNGSSYVGAGRTWRIWESSENSRAWLVTRGPEVAMWWPGMTHACLYGNPALWTAGQHNPQTAYLPMIHGGTFMVAYNAPIHAASTAAEQYMFPNVIWANGSDGVSRLYSNFDMMLSYNSNGYDSYTTKAFSVTGNDVLWYVPASNTSTRTFPKDRSTPKVVFNMGGKYYLSTSADLGIRNIMFDVGASNPGAL